LVCISFGLTQNFLRKDLQN